MGIGKLPRAVDIESGSTLFLFSANAKSLGAVIDNGFVEPGVLQSLLSRDTFIRIVDEDFT